MRNILASSALFLLLACSFTAHGQTKVNPQDQILWPGVTSLGIPNPSACDSMHYGMPWTDTLNNQFYVCSTTGWLGPFNGSGIAPQGSHTLAGCGVNYLGGLSFTIGACRYLINGTNYNSPLTTVTLGVGNSQDRIDVLAVDNTNTVVVLPGTPSSNPQKPTIDPSTQLELTFVYIPATATTLPAIKTNVIFDEGSEPSWHDNYGPPFYSFSTNNPYHLTHDIEATNPPVNSGVYFQSNSGPLNLQSYNSLVLYVRSKGPWVVNSYRQGFVVFWSYTGVYPATNAKVYITDGQYGFDASITDTYQQIVIPISDFQAGFSPVQDLVINSAPDVGANTMAGFYIDFIQLQGGLTQPTLPTTLMSYRGDWNGNVGYQTNDVVTANGTSYIALQATQQPSGSGPPVSNASFWKPLGQPSIGAFAVEQPVCSGTTCTLSFAPTTLLGFQRNGLMQTTAVDFTISGNTITLQTAAAAGDSFYAQYFH